MSIAYMKCRTVELEIPERNPFLNDKLDREHLSDVLTDVVTFYGQSGCVMALNGEWGAGKTTFVKMWGQKLKNNGFKTLYFNAWTTDFSDDALMSIISELKELSPQNGNVNKLASYAARIVLSVGKGILRKVTGVESEELDAAISETSEIGKEYLKEFAVQKETIEEFKRQVKEYVADNAKEHPVVFFVDELDRCNPNYAVSVLERVKHLFDIPNLVFVLAINKKQLCNAIQGYFGSMNMDSNEYLRRFIDIEYTLPTPQLEKFCNYLYDEYGFDEFFRNSERIQHTGFQGEGDWFKETAHQLCQASQVNLRQIDRIYAYARLALMQFGPSTHLMPDVYFMLCFWKVINPAFYNDIRMKAYTIQELLSKLEEVLPHSLYASINNPYELNFFVSSIASLIFSYDVTSQSSARVTQPSLAGVKDGEKTIYPIKSKYINEDVLNKALDELYSHPPREAYYGLSLVFNRIDLLENFKLN